MQIQKPLVVITGASAGIGAEIARCFAKKHHPVALTARRTERLELLRKELESQAAIYPLDVTDLNAVKKTMTEIEEKQGPISILVNNAGCAFGLEPAYASDLAEWDQCVDTNIKGVLHCTHTVLPSMVKRNRGHIVNVGSIAGHYPYPGGNVYGATKAFVHQFSLNLRADLIGTSVRVSCIEPGITAGTEFSLVRFRGDKEKAQAVYENTEPLQPQDIAEVIFFCCTLPPHVNINTVEMMPVAQAPATLNVHRTRS